MALSSLKKGKMDESVERKLVWIIMGIGVLLRFVHYLGRGSLWADEASLALNICKRNYLQLFQPLEYGQTAPIFFLLSTNFVTNIFGISEPTLRFLPFMAGVVSIVLFVRLARKMLGSREILLGLVLFVFSPQLIFYSAEFKQYSLDLLLSMVAILLGIWLYENRFGLKRSVICGLIGALLVWCSQPIIFSLFAVSILFLYYIGSQINRNRNNLTAIFRPFLSIVVCSALWLFSFMSNFFLFTRRIASPEMLHYWQEAFAPFPPTSISDILWYPANLVHFFRDPGGFRFSAEVFRPIGGRVLSVGAFGALDGMVLFTLIAALFCLWRSQNWKTLIITLSPIGITVVASSFHFYPFRARLILFLVPLLYVLLAKGSYNIYTIVSSQRRSLAIVFICILLSMPVAAGTTRVFKWRRKEEIKPVINYIVRNKLEKDVIYVYHDAVRAFEFYTRDQPISFIPVSWQGDWTRYTDELDQFKGKGRVWILFSHYREDEKKLFIDYLNRIGKQVDYYGQPGAVVYLYNL